MAASPKFKVYSASNEYLASFKHPSDAAVFVAVLGDGATIRYNHSSKQRALWVEGEEQQSAGESYDFVAREVYSRLAKRRAFVRAARGF